MIRLIGRLQRKLFREMLPGDINYTELLQKQKQGATIIDVRSEQEYKEGHIKGANLIPLYELNSKIIKKVPDKNQEIVLYCKSGTRSRKAYDILKNLGYKKIYNLYLGIDNINY